jgi:hypothetical protein
MATLEELFSYRNISEAIEATSTGIPNPLPPAFSSIKEQVIGNETTYHTKYGERRIVARTEYSSPSKATSQKKIGQKPLILTSFANHVVVEPQQYVRLREISSLAPVIAQRDANEFIAKVVLDHKTMYENNRIAHQVQLLNKAAYWYDETGKLLQSSSGAVVTVDMGVPAANKNQIGGTIATSWADAAADIFVQIENLKKKAVQNTGRPLKHAFYGQNIPGYLYKNTSFKHYFQFNPQYLAAFTSNPGVIPNGFLGLEWHQMRDAFYELEDETKVQLYDDDNVTFTPEIDKNVYTLFEGSVLVPTFVGVQQGSTPTSDLKYGICGYSVHNLDPVQMKLVMNDNVMPMWKNPLDMYIADCVF